MPPLPTCLGAAGVGYCITEFLEIRVMLFTFRLNRLRLQDPNRFPSPTMIRIRHDAGQRAHCSQFTHRHLEPIPLIKRQDGLPRLF